MGKDPIVGWGVGWGKLGGGERRVGRTQEPIYSSAQVPSLQFCLDFGRVDSVLSLQGAKVFICLVRSLYG